MEKIKVGGFAFKGEETIYGSQNGQPLPGTWEGNCIVYYRDGQCLFETGLTEVGDRYWKARKIFYGIGHIANRNIEWC